MRRVSSEDPAGAASRRKSAPAAAASSLKRISSERRNPTTKPPLSQHQRSNSLSSLYPATSISSFYQLNQEILHAFDSLYQSKQYKVAYAMGLQFIETALLEIPKHGYFYSKRHATERQQSSLEAERVCKLLKELEKEEQEKERLEKLVQLAREQRVATCDHHPDAEETYNWSDLSICGDAIQSYLCPIPEVTPKRRRSKYDKDSSLLVEKEEEEVVVLKEAKQQAVLPEENDNAASLSVDKSMVFEPLEKRQESSYRPQDEYASSSDWYEDSLSATESADLERALFLSGLDVRQPLDEETRPPTKAPGEIDVASLKLCFLEDFYALKNMGRVRISRIATHQGRLVGSINGCTVIAPLLIIHHFQNELDDANWPDPGLPDAVVEHVIDEETSGLLPQVRDKLGLTKDALIIPSDVHDFLIERGVLSQEQFVTVCGGNILNEAHLNEMLNSIVHVPDAFKGKKVGATVFFHEHVICILKLDRGNGSTWFDLIDSLPYEDTLIARPMDYYMNNVDPVDDSWMEEDYTPYAARIRCLDVDALRATLRWYACSKFNEQDCSYIDSYAWEDDRSDFDPRVFQAFVWAESVAS